jgi:transposase
MAARRDPGPGRIPGVPNVKRMPLFEPGGGVTPRHVMLAQKLAADGKTDVEIAEIFGVSEECINKWKRDSADFRRAVREGKMVIVAEAEETLRQMAMGGRESINVTEITGKNARTITTKERLHPDVRALTHILAVLHPEKWALNKVREGGENFESGDGVRGMRKLIGK